MSERWKYQIKIGCFWGIFMMIFSLLFDIKEKTIIEQISSLKFYFGVVVYILIGIFFLGYMSWREKVKKEKSEN